MPYRSNIPALRRGLSAAVGRGLQRGGAFVVDLARQLVPVDTSSLQRTIRQEPDGDLKVTVRAGDPTASRPTDGRPVVYAPFVEFGGGESSPAQPFLTPAFRAIDIPAEVAAEVRDLIRRSAL